MTNFMHLLYLILILLFLYLINCYLNKQTKENFSDFQKYKDLTSNIIQNICPPNPDTTYSFKLNKNYCTSNLFCPNKTDLCVNNHCVPQNIPFSPTVLQSCNGCPKPGLVSFSQ